MGVGKGHDANPLRWFKVSIIVQHGTGFPSSQCDQQEVLTYLSDEDEDDDGYPAYSHHDRFPPWWVFVRDDYGGNLSGDKIPP